MTMRGTQSGLENSGAGEPSQEMSSRLSKRPQPCFPYPRQSDFQRWREVARGPRAVIHDHVWQIVADEHALEFLAFVFFE